MMNIEIILYFFVLFLFVIGIAWGFWFLLRKFQKIISGYGVPLIGTTEANIQALIEHISLEKGQIFIDIGCGDGRVLEAVGHGFPQATVLGYENILSAYKEAVIRKEKGNLKYSVKKGNIFDISLHEADIIYAYMLPYLMKRIWKKVKSECRAGTLLYSNAFPIPGEPPHDTIIVPKYNTIYVYKVI